MTAEDLLRRLVRALDAAEIPYMWARAGQSQRQLEDAATVVRFQGTSLDVTCIQRWVRQLHLENEWRAVQASVKG